MLLSQIEVLGSHCRVLYFKRIWNNGNSYLQTKYETTWVSWEVIFTFNPVASFFCVFLRRNMHLLECIGKWRWGRYSRRLLQASDTDAVQTLKLLKEKCSSELLAEASKIWVVLWYPDRLHLYRCNQDLSRTTPKEWREGGNSSLTSNVGRWSCKCTHPKAVMKP